VEGAGSNASQASQAQVKQTEKALRGADFEGSAGFENQWNRPRGPRKRWGWWSAGVRAIDY
jgi:hypothetical protein